MFTTIRVSIFTGGTTTKITGLKSRGKCPGKSLQMVLVRKKDPCDVIRTYYSARNTKSI